ncbi:MAG: protein translocase subunit SecD [Patescibacteria group bacterium]
MIKSRTTIVFLIVLALFLAAAVFDYQPVWQTAVQKLNLPSAVFRPWRLGLDLVGGSYLIYEIDLNEVQSGERESVANGLRDVIERRVNLFGVSEPQVFTSRTGDNYRLVVELAGIKDVNQAIKQIGETPLLDFRTVAFEAASSTAKTDSGTPALEPKFIPTALTGRYVARAQVEADNITRKPQVNIEFNKDGAVLFESLTEQNVGRPLAIFLDNVLIEMPIVREKISGGKAQISGSFTFETAQELVQRFNAGALPAPITLASQQIIGASLGETALQKALWAGVLGTVAVFLFMVFYYRLFGFFAALALIVYIALTAAVFKAFSITMTLSGIAGFILSIGMAVDANILIFERIKEEVKKGVAKAAAVEEGFRRAWPSIRDSNITTIITSMILYYFTGSFVKGFALALLVGVLVSMFSAINVTRTFLRVFTRNK